MLVSLFLILQTFAWQSLSPGFHYKEVKDRINHFHLFKINPTHYSLSPFQYSEFKSKKPCTMDEWKKKLSDPILIINGAQYLPNYAHMGLITRDSKKVGDQVSSKWKALLASKPKHKKTQKFSIIDLSKTSLKKAQSQYHNIVQTFMLFDENQKLRVKNSSKRAKRNIFAINKKGEIVILISESHPTLYEVGTWLIEQKDLELENALSMDGGSSVMLDLQSEKLKISLPHASFSETGNHFEQYNECPLPNVIAFQKK